MGQDLETEFSPLSVKGALEFLRLREKRIEEDPQTNSVFDLALFYFKALQDGRASINGLSSIAHEVNASLLEERADAFRRQHFPQGHSFEEKMQEQLKALAKEGFQRFQERIESPNGGIVFTGHPTFALPKSVRDAFAAYVVNEDAPNKAALLTQTKKNTAEWAASITLDQEHDEVQRAIQNAQQSMLSYARHILRIARTAFPDRWKELCPCLPTAASWVGYDLDGRTDIQWTDSLTLRLKEKASQLRLYRSGIGHITEKYGDNGHLSTLTEKLTAAVTLTEEQAHLLGIAGDDPEKIVTAANKITKHHEGHLTDAKAITEALSACIDEAQTSDDMALELLAMKSLVEACQLGTARIHLRLNASQMDSVIRRELGTGTNADGTGRVTTTNLAALARQADSEDPHCASFADLYFEQTVAHRQFMMCSVILTHIDQGSPIRFLIAESESPATILSALFLAKRYGVAQNLDISPLFETPHALLTGARFIEHLLNEDIFKDYIRHRGYLSIQLGFSDAGRFVGQVAANMAIERLHNLIGRLLPEEFPDTDLLIFNTHGESIGRGAFPGSFEDRLNHALTPWTRSQNEKRDLHIRHEVSFQGGDGYLHFGDQRLSDASYYAFCISHLSATDQSALSDPFYTETDFVWDTYRAIKSWHEVMFQRKEYEALLSDFASGFLVRAGSRARRRGDARGPRALRAISHNATLQQLGVPLNSAGGIGSAMPLETERLLSLINRSARMRHLIDLAFEARLRTSVPALRGYATVYSPYLWTGLSHQQTGPKRDEYIRVHSVLEHSESFPEIMRIADTLAIDLLSFDDLLSRLDSFPPASERHKRRRPIHLLHAIRQALMMQALTLTASLPQFSDRHGVDVREVVEMVHAMQLDRAVDLLCEIFPKSRDPENAFDHLQSINKSGCIEAKYGYENIHADVIAPLKEISETNRSISLAISHVYAAYG